MRALTLTEATGPDAARLADVADPAPAAGEVLVALKAAALNHRELWITRGLYPGMTLPATLGCDGAGVITAVGAGVADTMIGQRIVVYPGIGWGDDARFPAASFGLLGMPGPGTIAERIVLSADDVLPMPHHLSFPEAAALPLGLLTAWRGLMTKGGLTRDDTLLITGIGGGVATFALAIAIAVGARVFVTSGSDETITKAVALGAAGGVNYRTDDWKKTLGKATGGIDLVFDGAPATSYPGYGRALAMGARVVIYGSTGGPSFPVNAPELFLKNVTITGTNVGNREELARALAFVAEHHITPVIDRTFPIVEAAAALAYLDTSHGFGKVVVTIAE